MTTLANIRSRTDDIAIERRHDARHLLSGHVWMVDHAGCTMLPCKFMDISKSGMLLRAPLGYGVADGNLYEIRTTQHCEPDAELEMALCHGRLAQVRWTRSVMDERGEFIEVGVQFV